MTDPDTAGPPLGSQPRQRTVVRSPYSDGEWHRLHPLTPLLRGGLTLVVIVGVIVANLRERLVEWVFPVFTDLPPGSFPPTRSISSSRTT